jgi:Mg2+ and Co2+ transporter CorA
VAALRSTAERLNEFYRTVQDDRMNRTLYILTLVTTIFIPAQFLTGLYGMNFNTESSPYNLPELSVKYGYIYFWCFLVVSSLLMVSCLRSTFKVNRQTETVEPTAQQRERMPWPLCCFRRAGATL